MKIYKTTDRLDICIDDITVTVAPLNYIHKSEVQAKLVEAANGDTMAGLLGARLAVQYAVKKIKGISNSDDTPYELEFEGDIITDGCADDLLNSFLSLKLQLVCYSLLTGVTEEFLDPSTGQKLEGVDLIKKKKPKNKKK